MSGSGDWRPCHKCGASLAAVRVVGMPSVRHGLTLRSVWRERLARRAVEAMHHALLGSERKSRE
jgi:hypothetical protein